MIKNWKLIDFYHEHPDLMKKYQIIDTEMQPVYIEAIDPETGYEYISPTNGDHPAEFYSVYVRQDQTENKGFNPVICIADLSDAEDALAFENFIRILLKLVPHDRRSIL